MNRAYINKIFVCENYLIIYSFKKCHNTTITATRRDRLSGESSVLFILFDAYTALEGCNHLQQGVLEKYPEPILLR